MAKVITMPRLDFAQEEGTMGVWYKKIGESFHKGEHLFDVYTGKSVVTVDAAESATLLKTVIEKDATVPVFTPIAVIGNEEEDADTVLEVYNKEHGFIKEGSATEIKSQSIEVGEDAAELPFDEADIKSIKLTPKAQKLVREKGYDVTCLTNIQGTGFQGGITAKDIKASPMARKLAAKFDVDLQMLAEKKPNEKLKKKDVIEAAKKRKDACRCEKEEKIIDCELPYIGTRQIIGERLSHSKFTAPHLYFTNAVDVSELQQIRKRLIEETEINVSFSDLIVLAVKKALTKYPEMNAALIDGQIVRYQSINIGLAVGGTNGLVVPVIKQAQQKTLEAISAERSDLVKRAKEGRLLPSEYQNGTFTISNLGMFGIDNFTAIINPPEAAILAVSAIKKKPVVICGKESTDEIVIRPMMNIQLSVDHRIIDGLLAAEFIEFIRTCLEKPIKLLI